MSKYGNGEGVILEVRQVTDRSDLPVVMRQVNTQVTREVGNNESPVVMTQLIRQVTGVSHL